MIIDQYQRIRAVILSCNKYIQLEACERMVDNFIYNNRSNSYYARYFSDLLRKKIALKKYYYEI